MNRVENLEIENQFLCAFERAWNNTLQSYRCSQDQLIQGSRLRPLMVLWGYLSTLDDFSFAEMEYIANVAVSVELLHKATIILDDWIDEDETRHGKMAFHIEYGPYFTVILSLHMVSDAILRLKNFLPSDISLSNSYFYSADIIAQTIYSMSKGALEELRLEENIFDLEHIKMIAQLETAEIIGNAMQLGYFAGNGKSSSLSSLFKYLGDRFGYLFQAMNDLEIFADPKRLIAHKGNSNNDIGISRKNLGVAMLYHVANQAERTSIIQKDPDKIRELILKYNIIDFVVKETDLFCKTIPEKIQSFPASGLSQEWVVGYLTFIVRMKQKALDKLGLEQ